MTNYLHDEEEQLVEDFEQALDDGTLITEPNFGARKKELQQAARNTLNKTRNINIRLTERGLHRLKAKAIEEGISYQTLAASILHKSTAK